MSAVIIKQFRKDYGSFTAVKSLDLTVPKGQIVGFVGKNGAGKSTTLRSMLGMIHLTEGSISILGLDSERDNKAIKAKVAYVPSEAAFYDNITCRKLLTFAASFSGAGAEQIEALATRFELDLGKKVNELSLGNRKKVSLIIGFLKDAELFVFDEPTNGLDPLMQNKFFELVAEKKNAGATVFLSSHNLSEIEKYCDKVAIIKDGDLVDYLDMSKVKINHKQHVTYQTRDGQSESFELDSDINQLVSKLAQLDLVSLEIKTSTVEQEFISYYTEEGEENEKN